MLCLLPLLLAAAVPVAVQEPPVEHQLKLVETIFCKGFSGECQNVTSWDEIKKQDEVAKKRAIAAAQAKYEAEERILKNKAVIYGSPKDFPLGEIKSSIVRSGRTISQGVVVNAGAGAPHENSRHPAYFPDGLPPGNFTISPMPVVSNAPPNGTRWQDTVNRFPHQRPQNWLHLPASKEPTVLAEISSTRFDNVADGLQALIGADPVASNVTSSNATSIVRNATAVASDAAVIDKLQVASRHVGEVHHFVGYKLIDEDWRPDQSGLPFFDKIPRRSDCEHRFSFKCFDASATSQQESQAPPPLPSPVPVASATVPKLAKLAALQMRPVPVVDAIPISRVDLQEDELGEEIVREEIAPTDDDSIFL